MVRVGPWTVESVEHGPWRRCDRCDARHKEVWTCTVDAEAHDVLSALKGQRTWRIGSTCGPTLMLVSEEVWKNETGELAKALHLLVRARRALEEAAKLQITTWVIPLIGERADLLQRRDLSPYLTRWLSSHVTQLENAIKSKRRADRQ